MASIHGVATITAKGQITLPKAIRQALGVDLGGKVAFDLVGSQVIVSRVADEDHDDPAIASFLRLLEQGIRSGQNMTALPDDLARSMLASLDSSIDTNEEIDGDVAL